MGEQKKLRDVVTQHGVWKSELQRKEESDDDNRLKWYNQLPDFIAGATLSYISKLIDNFEFQSYQKKSLREGYHYYCITIPEMKMKWKPFKTVDLNYSKTIMSPAAQVWYNSMEKMAEEFREFINFPNRTDSIFGLDDVPHVLKKISDAICVALDADDVVFNVSNYFGNRAYIRIYVRIGKEIEPKKEVATTIVKKETTEEKFQGFGIETTV